jgi:hypothetical protein
MSYNTAYPSVVAEPVARYVKTVATNLTGRRLDVEGKTPVEWCITSDNTQSEYEDAVVELYSDAEHTFFKRINRVLFTEGWIKPFAGGEPVVNTANYMDDVEIEKIASMRRIADLEKALEPITSATTLARILILAEERGMTKRMRDSIEAKMVSVR